jgi:hypothetical protein
MRGRQWSPEALFDFPFIAPTWMLRRRTFLDAGGFDETLPNLEDWEFAFRLHGRGGFVALEDTLLIKHGSADGLNKEAPRQVASLQQIRAKHPALFAASARNRAELARRLAAGHLRLGDLASARRALREVLADAPTLAGAASYAASFLGLRVTRATQRRLRPD